MQPNRRRKKKPSPTPPVSNTTNDFQYGIFADTRLSLGARVSYGIIKKHAIQDNWCMASVNTLAKETGCRPKTVYGYHKELEKYKYILIQKGANNPFGNGKRVRLVWLLKPPEVDKNSPTGENHFSHERSPDFAETLITTDQNVDNSGGKEKHIKIKRSNTVNRVVVEVENGSVPSGIEPSQHPSILQPHSRPPKLGTRSKRIVNLLCSSLLERNRGYYTQCARLFETWVLEGTLDQIQREFPVDVEQQAKIFGGEMKKAAIHKGYESIPDYYRACLETQNWPVAQHDQELDPFETVRTRDIDSIFDSIGKNLRDATLD